MTANTFASNQLHLFTGRIFLFTTARGLVPTGYTCEESILQQFYSEIWTKQQINTAITGT